MGYKTIHALSTMNNPRMTSNATSRACIDGIPSIHKHDPQCYILSKPNDGTLVLPVPIGAFPQYVVLYHIGRNYRGVCIRFLHADQFSLLIPK